MKKNDRMRYYKLLLLFLVFFFPLQLISQEVEIDIKVIQSFSPKAKLYLYKGNDVQLIDSSFQVSAGEYKFLLNEGYSQGLYRIDIGSNIKIDFVVGNEPIIDINTTVYAPEDSLSSSKSIENEVFWDYKIRKKNHKQHTWFIESLLNYYTDTMKFYNLLSQELDNQKYILNSYVSQLVNENPNLLSAKYIALENLPLLTNSYENEFNGKYFTQVWWDGVDLNDPRILHSPALQVRVWSYIEQFFSDKLDKEEQDQAFIEAIELLMERKMSRDVRLYIRDNLAFGFNDTDYDIVLEYVETTRFDSIEPIKAKGSSRFSNKFPRVKVGDRAFDFEIDLGNGKKKKLSKINAKYKLVLFWSTWCPHCIETMPRISQIYNDYKDLGLEVIAVSIDEEEELWKQYISKMGLNWINIRVPFSLENELFLMYDVNETPKMFLLSKDLEILSRPSTRKQLENRMKRLTK